MRTLGDWIRLNHRRNPGRDAFVDDGGRIRHGEAAERAWGLARGLRELRIENGDRVGVLAGNSVFNAEVFLAAGAAGAVYVAYNWRWSAQELADGIIETEASVIVVEPQHRPLLDEALAIVERAEAAPAIILEGDEVDAARTGTGEFVSSVDSEDALCIIYTGGSTGVSKGVVLSHRAATANALNEIMDCELGSRPGDRGLVLTPMFHSASLLCWIMAHYVSGSTSVIAAKADHQTVADWFEREAITNTFMIPNMMRKAMGEGLFSLPAVRSNLRALHTGAGLLRMPDKERFRDLLPATDLYFRYGLTEAGPMVTRLRPADMFDPRVDGSIGREYLLAEAEVMDDEGRVVAPGELGEICVKGPGLMSGYYGREEASREAFRHGWLRTGDLATRDERGYFFFKDRLKDMIKTGGENVYCAEVEQVLYLHPAVQEAAVVGVPDAIWDEEVRAVVSLREGAAVSDEELRTFLRGYLAGYKIPKKFAFVAAEQLPRSGAGKLVKAQLKMNLGWVS